jgi:ZIP family zinc transporter
MKKQLSSWIERLLLGFASGVMIAASVWSLLLPSLEQTEGEWMPAAIGFITGVGFLLAVDTLTPHLNVHSREREGTLHLGRNKTAEINKISSHTMLYIAVTIHNFPEGMAVGAVLAGIFSGSTEVGYAGAIVLATGIGVQNFPEGAIISMPLRGTGMARWKSFGLGTLSGLAEPAGAVLTIVVASQMITLLPYCLAFAAGAMIYVVVDELIPEAKSDDCFNIGTIGAALGFVLMMVLDVSLG